MNRSNLFNPFDSRSIEHEDRLTWAFLVALKYDPALQDFLRELVESQLPPELREYSNTWEPANVSTQTKWIESSTIPLVSVLLTDVSIQERIKVKWSDREPRYDGVIEYPSRMTLIIENKLYHGNVWREQLSPSRDSFSGDINDDTLHGSAICLEWSEVLEGVLKYADADIAPFSSREIARDFLSFVEEVHPGLTPYRTFKLCDERPEALERRNVSLLATLASETGLDDWGYLFRPGKIAERVGIDIPKMEPWRLRVDLNPASTAWQADLFCKKVNKEVNKENFLSLNEQEWDVAPNLNFSFRGRKLIWATTAWETLRYLDYFFSGERPYGRMYWDTLSPLIEQWEYWGLISSGDREEIEYQRNETNRPYLDVNPEFSVSREWNLDTVIELEERGKLEAYIIDALATPLATWEEPL